MSAEVVQVDDSNAKIALGKFRLSLAQTDELMTAIGMSMLLSIRRTFREKGSPAGSWAPLAPSTIKSNPTKYGAGHQLLIDKSTLLNSIGVHKAPGSVVIGTNLKYAAVHQFGSRDRGSVFGPRTQAMEEATVKVGEHTRLQSRFVGSRDGHRLFGPRNRFKVGSHSRHQNIPARPYCVFRPEDPRRIQSLVNRFCRKAAATAGLGGAE